MYLQLNFKLTHYLEKISLTARTRKALKWGHTGHARIAGEDQMNAEEMERSIEFLLKSQATLENQIERTSRQIEETNNRLEIQAETQTEFIKIVTQQIEAQGAINASLRASLALTDERINQTDERINQTDERINQADERLNQTDERINQTDARLDRLAALVEQHIGGG